MKKRTFLAAALVCALTSVSCQTGPTRMHGDAVLREYGPAASFRLPEFSIGERGRFEFAVSNLEERAFPYKLEIRTTRANAGSWSPPTPFESAEIQIDIVTPTGRIMASQVVRLRTWTATGAGRYEQVFWKPGQPEIGFLADYTVRVTVLSPSRRSWDKASLSLR